MASLTVDRTVSTSGGDESEVGSPTVDCPSKPGMAGLEAGRRCRHHQLPTEPRAPTTAAPTAVAVKFQPRLPAAVARGIGVTGGCVHVGVGCGEGNEVTTLSTVGVGEGLTVGKALGDALRAAATYSSPPRSLRELPLLVVCVGAGLGGLLCDAGDVVDVVPAGWVELCEPDALG
jgi:hypothetical protein